MERRHASGTGWLGSNVGPGEKFYLVADSGQALSELIGKAAKIG